MERNRSSRGVRRNLQCKNCGQRGWVLLTPVSGSILVEDQPKHLPGCSRTPSTTTPPVTKKQGWKVVTQSTQNKNIRLDLGVWESLSRDAQKIGDEPLLKLMLGQETRFLIRAPLVKDIPFPAERVLNNSVVVRDDQQTPFPVGTAVALNKAQFKEWLHERNLR